MRKIFFLLIIILGQISIVSGQTNAVGDLTPPVYPKVIGYFSFILPIVKINKNETTNDFSDFNNGFAIGFPVGINILYNDKFGVSYEFTPTIKTGSGSSKVSNLLFDPGLIFRFKKGYAFVSRLAFETSGRYGITPVVTKIIKGKKNINYFMSVSVPLRVGNSELPTMGGNLQFGLIFN